MIGLGAVFRCETPHFVFIAAVLSKGVAEADPTRLTVLAQTAVPVEELQGARLASEQQLAEAQAAEAKDDLARMNADALLDVLKRIQLKAA